MAFFSALLLALALAPAADPPEVPVGAAVVDITPETPIRLTGYESRKAESEGVEQRLKARALAIGSDADGPAVLVAVDNCAVPGAIVEQVARRLRERANLPRERFVVAATHTHCAPALAGPLPMIFGGPLPDDQREHIDRYSRALTDRIEEAARAALAARRPARLSWGQGAAIFAANRRVLKDGRWVGFGVNPDGPVDHSLPILRVSDPDGKTRAVLVNYACHCTTLGGDFNKVCGDWAGYACEQIERDHPGATALVVIGCGADANPEPREGLDFAKRHGEDLAREVNRLLKTNLTPLSGPIAARIKRIDLPLGPLPPRSHWEASAKEKGAVGYHARVQLERLDRGESLPTTLPYVVQTWAFGDDLAMVFLAGEVVVDYARRLKRECTPGKLWISAYCNDVPSYIASRRLLGEGGYEVDSSMIYYDRPTRLAPEAEDRIVEAVLDLLPEAFHRPGR